MKLWIPAERILQNICHMVEMKSEYKLVKMRMPWD